MNIKTEFGRVVWHDLMTLDVAKAERFYASLLGWAYHIEYASDFVWKPGEEADYPLLLAHGGLIGAGHDIPSHWLTFVTVEDVDAATARAKRLGATIGREPFDTPGVGRASVIQDPQGAIICTHTPVQDFPLPSGLFLWDELMTNDVEHAKMFYGELFGWRASDVDMGELGPCTMFKRDDDTHAAGARKRSFDVPKTGRFAVLSDPPGAVFGLLAQAHPANHEPEKEPSFNRCSSEGP